eukprot:TRINITY_DN4492_c0_g1_i2.p1 TRINITY_DN4492_c0_g1~~TRINITY_DN4492_c0_g1_i2.p1  ORF type:complete len:330 (-),score=51.35 TRINITY_DN4492_c0_g1_i2:75-1064(-)
MAETNGAIESGRTLFQHELRRPFPWLPAGGAVRSPLRVECVTGRRRRWPVGAAGKFFSRLILGFAIAGPQLAAAARPVFPALEAIQDGPKVSLHRSALLEEGSRGMRRGNSTRGDGDGDEAAALLDSDGAGQPDQKQFGGKGSVIGDATNSSGHKHFVNVSDINMSASPRSVVRAIFGTRLNNDWLNNVGQEKREEAITALKALPDMQAWLQELEAFGRSSHESCFQDGYGCKIDICRCSWYSSCRAQSPEKILTLLKRNHTQGAFSTGKSLIAGRCHVMRLFSPIALLLVFSMAILIMVAPCAGVVTQVSMWSKQRKAEAEAVAASTN